MPRRDDKTGASGLVRRLLPMLALLALALVPASRATAASVSAASSHGGDDHARVCKCRGCDPESCCCGPRKAKAAPTRVGPAATPSTGSGPCLKSAPCGDAGLPGSPSTCPVARIAALAPPGPRFSASAGRFSPLRPRPSLPARRASRLDEPPEYPTPA